MSAAVGARRLHVAPEGAEFRTIQSAVDAARPGDTILVAGGVYRETVKFPRGGEPGRPITVQAETGRIALVRPPGELTGEPVPVEGYPSVYRWAGFRLPAPVGRMGLWEASSHLRLTRVYSIEDCEQRLASWFYDPAAKALFVRSSGAGAAKDLLYVVEDGQRPVFEVRRTWIVLDGLQAAFGDHGALIRTHDVVVRNCRFFCNRKAGVHLTGDNHVIEGNEFFRNNHYGLQMRYGGDRCVIRGNRSYYNGPNNGEITDTSLPTDIGTYSSACYTVFEDNIIDGLHQYAFRNKFGANNSIVFRRNVVRGYFYCQSPCTDNNTAIVDGYAGRFGQFINRITRKGKGDLEAVDPDGRRRLTNLIHPAVHKDRPLFADPSWRDFRLQGRSPYHGRGAYPGYAPVWFVDPVEGDDANDGRSRDAAFRSLARVCAILNPGHTVYLAPGVYDEPLDIRIGGLSPEEPVVFRALGKSSEVTLRGGVLVAPPEKADLGPLRDALNAARIGHVVLAGLTVTGKGAQLRRAFDVAFSECVFADCACAVEALNCSDVRADHVTVADARIGLRLRKTPGVAVTNSLFVGVGEALALDAASAETYYGDFNAFTRPRFAVSRRVLASLDGFRKTTGHEANSRAADVALCPGWALPVDSPLNASAHDFTFVGARPARASERLEIRDLRVAGLAPRGASLLWETPRGATEGTAIVKDLTTGKTTRLPLTTQFQIMGEWFDMTWRISSFFTTDRHVSLPNLTPGRDYEVTVECANVERTATHSETLRFSTPRKRPAGRRLYVSTPGDDDADGLTVETAWRTLRKACASAGPGDHVTVLAGVYPETLRPRVSGVKGAPIVFESAEPGGAVLDLRETQPVAIEIVDVNFIHVIGFGMCGGAFSKGRNVAVANARGVRVAHCRVAYPRVASFAELKLGHSGLVATDAPGLTVENNVFLCGAVCVGVAGSPGTRIANNVLLGEGNYGVVLVPGARNERYAIRNNIFCRIVLPYKSNPNIWIMNLPARVDCDHNLFYIPDDHNATIGKTTETDRLRNLAEWRERTGFDTHSIEAMPLFVDPENGDFRLAPGSPGLDLADDGAAVGIRPIA